MFRLPTKSSTLTVAAQYIQDLCAKFSAGLNSLLDLEDNVDVHCGTTCAKPIIENSSPKKYLGLKTDCCDELLPFLEKAVCCQWWSESSSLKLDNALANTSISNSAKNGSLVDLSTDPKLTLPIYDSECCQHVASLSMLIGLKVLKQVVCYSAKVCHYLISSMCSNVTLTAPGPSNIEDHIDISYETPPTSASYNIIQRLFSLCGSHSHDIVS